MRMVCCLPFLSSLVPGTPHPLIVGLRGGFFHPRTRFWAARARPRHGRLVGRRRGVYDDSLFSRPPGERTMSIDKSLRRKNQLARLRNVLTRGERIKQLQHEDRWTDGRSPFGLPKVRVLKIGKGKAKKAKEEEKAAEGAAAPGAAAA